MSRQYKVRMAVGDTASMNVDSRFVNWIAAVTYFTDGTYTTPTIPSAGSVTVSGHIPGAGDNSAFNNSPIDASDIAAYCSGSAPLDSVRITGSGIIGATHMEVTVTGAEG